MWVISGPFDGQEKGDIGFKKAKLLKTASRYTLGRKERELVVNHAKVSHDHGAITVSSYPQDNVADPSFVPNLSMHNAGKKTMTITRGDDVVHVVPSGTEELQDGDTIDIIVGVPLSVQWRQVCCLAPSSRGKSISLDACASLGISIVHTSHPSVTHHLIPQFLANASIATSLISAAQFVKPEWLNEIIRLGNLPINDNPSNGSSLEQVFALPPETKFRPTFGAALPTSLKVFKVWEPNEERMNMLRGYRFLFVGEKGREVEGAMTELVARGGGHWAAFNVASGRKEWHHVLAKEKAKHAKANEKQKGLVVVADPKAMAVAVGHDQWKELVDEARSFNLDFVRSDTILQVVLHLDIALIAPSSDIDMDELGDRSSSPLPDFVPNTHPDELSCPPAEPGTGGRPSRNLKRRATPSAVSRPSTPPPQSPSQKDEAPPPRKLLKRRAKAAPPSIIGIDDPSIIDGAPDATTTEIPVVNSPVRPSTFADTVTPIPARSSRLKRRAGTIASGLANTQTTQSETIQQSGQEPPLKKFKALFDASHPDRHSTQNAQSSMTYEADTPGSQSLPQSGTQTQSSATSGSGMNAEGARLDVVAEEKSGMTWTQDRGAKRKAMVRDGEDAAEMAGYEEVAETPGRSAKKQAVEDVNAVLPSGPNNAPSAAMRSKLHSSLVTRPGSKTGAAPGKPDTDAAFLKAVASTKRGKKMEDEFDREFNKLKISKPDVQNHEHEKEWAVLDDFEDRGIRGNFMVVVEMDVYSKENGQRRTRVNTATVEWQDRPNFKKFKKKPTPGSRTKVELVVHEENDYGMGSAYWKGPSQSQSQGPDAEMSQARIPKQLEVKNIQATRRGRDRGFVVVDSDDDVKDALPRKSKAVQSQAAKAVQNRAGPSQVTQTREKAQPLFLDSEHDRDEFCPSNHDDDEDDEIVDDRGEFNDDAMTLQSSTLKTQEPSAPQTRSSKQMATKRGKKTPVIVDDESDDGATFKGFRGKKRGAR